MSKTTTATTETTTEEKPKRKIRTLDERIAELQAKAALQEEREAQRLTKRLDEIDTQLAAAEAKVATLRERRDEVAAALGIDEEDEIVEALVAQDEAASTEEPALIDASQN